MMLCYKKMSPNARVPQQASVDAACFDLFAAHPALIQPGEAGTIDTGLAFDIPIGHAMMVYSRSGHGFKYGVRLSNCVGVIDADYRGNVYIRLHNDGPTAFRVDAGDRIAQAMVIQVPYNYEFYETDNLSETLRGVGGIGSTGK